jgi:Na+-driven multidrug efflux pump
VKRTAAIDAAIYHSVLTHREYWALAIPLIVSTLSTPILGVVATAVVGRLTDSSYIGGVAVSSLIFNTLYWLFSSGECDRVCGAGAGGQPR